MIGDWTRQLGLPCEYCRAPGHLILVPPLLSVVQMTDEAELMKPLPLNEHMTCPEHRFLVENRARRLQDEARFAERDHGRPVLGTKPWGR